MTDNFDIPQYTLITYNRDDNGVPNGVLVAVKVDNVAYNIGFAQCRAGDRFSKKFGLKIAIERALKRNISENDLPFKLRSLLPSFLKRCRRYYQPNLFNSLY